MNPAAEQLAGSMLYEGYALYPYTPGAAKNATPTPFGIVYPPAYAALEPVTLDLLRVEVVAEAPIEAEVEAELLFLQPSGQRHQAMRRRVQLESRSIESLLAEPYEHRFVFEPGAEDPATGEPRSGHAPVVTGSMRLTAEHAPGRDGLLIRLEVRNTTPVPDDELEGMERPEALRRSLISAHALLGLDAGRFVSPLESASGPEPIPDNVNTWPVLATPEDDVVLGAAYFLPDHPQMAPESRHDMFDNTEIEEALLLHVKALSDSEREEISRQDPAVREMLERADAATAEDVMALHGRTEIRDAPGERELMIDGRVFRPGDKVVLRPGGRDPYDTMLDGRRATIARMLVDYDGKAHIGVTIDDDPMSEVLREANRHLFFFADEIEVAR